MCGLKRILLVLAAMTPPCMLAADVTRAATVPFTWREDFQGSELGQFASYPPVQDAGYDPSLLPTSEYGAPGGRALMRVLEPVRPGPVRSGFIRRLDLVAVDRATLSFSYRFEGAASGDQAQTGGVIVRRYRWTGAKPGIEYTSDCENCTTNPISLRRPELVFKVFI